MVNSPLSGNFEILLMRHTSAILIDNPIAEWIGTFEAVRNTDPVFIWESITVRFNALD
jgi:hypothetical protein